MRLIDAYKAMKSIDEIACSMSVCINSDYCHGMTAMKDAAIHAIEEQPTVDAVPIEWIKNYIKRTENNGNTFAAVQYEMMLWDYLADEERRSDEQQ